MATSGSYNFSVNRNEITEAALRAIKALSPYETVRPDQLVDGAEALNMIVKQWQGKADFAPGLKVFSRQRITLFLASGQQRYLIGPASTDARATAQYGRTTISANEAAGQTVLSITSNTDTTTYPGTTVTMTNGDIIGIELNDGTIQWTTISGTPSTTATVADSLTLAADAGNYVWWFTSRAQRPVVVETAVLRDENYKDTPLEVTTRVEDYDILPDKGADGDPTGILVEPQRINTAITCNTQPSDVTKVINLSVLYPAEDYDTATDDVAFPQEWFRALKFQLALDLWPEYREGDPPMSLRANRDEAISIAQNANPETTDVFFEPNR